MENTPEEPFLKCRTFVCQACHDVVDVLEEDVQRWHAEAMGPDGVVWHEGCPVNDELRESYYREFEEGTYVQMYVNVYDVHRVYGGPEEGGWWYDAGSPVCSIPVPGRITREMRHGESVLRSTTTFYFENIARQLVRASYGDPDGSTVVRVEDHPAEEFPRYRPHYE